MIAPLPEVFLPGGREPKTAGLDLGLAALVILDDGEKLLHPRPLKKYEKQLASLQRDLHRKEKGSKNRVVTWSSRSRRTSPILAYRRAIRSRAFPFASYTPNASAKAKSSLLYRRALSERLTRPPDTQSGAPGC